MQNGGEYYSIVGEIDMPQVPAAVKISDTLDVVAAKVEGSEITADIEWFNFNYKDSNKLHTLIPLKIVML